MGSLSRLWALLVQYKVATKGGANVRSQNESSAGAVQLVILAIVALVLLALVLFLLSLSGLIASPLG
jgi:hypothetical protein